MKKKEVATRIRVMQTLVEMMVRELPEKQQIDLIDRLIDRLTGDEGETHIAEEWDYRLTRRRPGDLPNDEGDPAHALDDIIHGAKRRAGLFGSPDKD